ncbi:beta-ketoacyl synthase N-terminal-like domain-containing protein [Paenibacillus lutimineralis]|uniref:Beta-ketoacyl-ACP synthase n=1 Tax=Paenibacillus lutimineralis TaxID=2707005 RepID=A0A3S9UV46_9BACL|nr:beta-ketoacyl synthase N-terminal-like domain-containing protein [Paenibacillus lutimineralis]AZS14166.1 beta-ketoacyl-ACP synthase [Paenibacillus lutimineralis]
MKTSSSASSYSFRHFHPVVVTGIGVAGAAAVGAATFEQVLREGRSSVGYLTGMAYPNGKPLIGAEAEARELQVGFQRYAPGLSRTAGRLFKISGKSVQASSVAAAEAWQQAGLEERSLNHERIGIIVAGSNISPAVSYSAYKEYGEQPELLHPRYALSYMDTNQIGVLSEMFGICGEGMTVGGASASGNAAILRASQWIQLGLVDVCMVVGAMADLSPLELQGYLNIGAYGGSGFEGAPKQACRPFDRRHEGFILGQTSACLILECASSAADSGAEVLATVIGGAAALDGHSLSNPSEDGQVRTMKEALRRAGLPTSSIDYINAHGTSTPLGDLTELASIRRVFGEHLGRVRINSTKALTGHCLYAAGVVEAASVIIQMKGGFLHPQINLEEPVSREHYFATQKAEAADFTYALSNSYGFGGINTSIIFKKGLC